MTLGCHILSVLFGGSANNGSNAGLSYSNSNNSPANSNANIGSQLGCFFERMWSRASWRKINNSMCVLVAKATIRGGTAK